MVMDSRPGAYAPSRNDDPLDVSGFMESMSRSSVPSGAASILFAFDKGVYCGPVLRQPAGPIQAANFRSAIAF
jgi:hypothetical protein